MAFPIITIIGAGNMGSSLIAGLIKNGHPADKIVAADPDQEKLALLESKLGIQTTADNETACENANVIILAVKPQVMAATVKGLAESIKRQRPLIISIAAGITEESIHRWSGNNASIVRAMPNTPALLGAGATALYTNAQVTNAQKEIAEFILRAVGIVIWVKDESQMDAVTAISGSGPAYFFMIMETLEKAGIELGLPDDLSHLLVIQTALGAAKMSIENNLSLSELRKQVTSPGGTTEKALLVLEEHHFADILKKAVAAAKSRSEELAKSFGAE